MIPRDALLLVKPKDGHPYAARSAVNHRPSGPPESDYFPVVMVGSGHPAQIPVAHVKRVI